VASRTRLEHARPLLGHLPANSQLRNAARVVGRYGKARGENVKKHGPRQPWSLIVSRQRNYAPDAPE
jgi:hypothetical protein